MSVIQLTSGIKTQCTANGTNDGVFRFNISGGTGPYTIELKWYENVNEYKPVSAIDFYKEAHPYFYAPTEENWALIPMYRLVENVQGDVEIGDLKPGLYLGRIYDSSEPKNVNIDLKGWFIECPPKVKLKGTVNPMGMKTAYWFEYWEAEESPKRIPPWDVFIPDNPWGSGIFPSKEEQVNFVMGSFGRYGERLLKNGTTYNGRIGAKAEGGIPVYGEPITFTTPAILPVAVTLPAEV